MVGTILAKKHLKAVTGITYLGRILNKGQFGAARNISLASLNLIQDDLVIAFCSTNDNAARTCSVATAGYTTVDTKIDAADTNRASSLMSYKFMSVTPDTTISLSAPGSASAACIAYIEAFRGVNLTTPIDVAAVKTSNINGSLVNPGSITPITSGAFIICAGNAALPGTETGGAFTSSDLIDFTSNHQDGTVTDGVAGIGHKLWTGGAFDAAAWAGIPSTATDSWTGWAVALRPK